ncbi:PepSY domain-containing protein [Methylophaga sp.]|uniref:PepSY domain-containing protein n=1 Tax=Methylophaga sp. TaxID=2024840 RepID=UPI003F698864
MLKYSFLLATLLLSVSVMAGKSVPYEHLPGNSINEIELPLNRHTAAELAKIETEGKILSVDEEIRDNETVFRIKVLHNNGKVKVHRIHRDTGHAVP